MSTLAISYSRFSHPGQAEGDSEKRQQEAFIRFCERHNLRPAKQSFIDRGLSGYSGKHRSKGELGQLEELAKRHTWPKGTTIVIEAWDRLGRLRPDKQIELIAGLLRTGLRIGVTRLDDIFSEDDFGTHKWTTLSVFCQLAFQESQQKAERLAHSWKSRREQARKRRTPVTTLVPGWLQMRDGAIVINPERVAVVKRIFQMAGSGYGVKRIIRVLAAEGVKPFGRAHHWSSTYVRKLLSSRQALGEFQPEKYEDLPDGTRRKVKDGPPIKGYYPAVVTEDEYALAQQGLGGRKGRSGPRQRRFINLWAGMLKNAWIPGDTMFLTNKGSSKEPRLYLLNDAGGNSGHRQWRFSYEIFEKAILRLLREVPVSVIAPSEPIPVVDTLQARFDAINADIQNLKADLRRGYSASITEVMREKEIESSTIKSQLDQAKAEAAHPLSDTWKEAGDLMAAVERGGEDARLRLKAALKRCIESMTLLIIRRGIESCCFVDCRFKSGSKRVYVIWHKPCHKCGKQVQPGYWSALSAPTTASTDLASSSDQEFARGLVRSWQEPAVGAVNSRHCVKDIIQP